MRTGLDHIVLHVIIPVGFCWHPCVVRVEGFRVLSFRGLGVWGFKLSSLMASDQTSSFFLGSFQGLG